MMTHNRPWLGSFSKTGALPRRIQWDANLSKRFHLTQSVGCALTMQREWDPPFIFVCLFGGYDAKSLIGSWDCCCADHYTTPGVACRNVPAFVEVGEAGIAVECYAASASCSTRWVRYLD